MTKDIEWGELLTGPEIKALGLPGDTPVSADNMPLPLRDWALLSDTPFYQLPDDHPAYIVLRYNKAHGTNFVYWEGGDEAPDDWDGGDVLWGDGLVEPTPKHPGMWLRECPIDYLEIIGYTKKPQLVTEEASEPLQSAELFDAPANLGPAADDNGEAGDFIPCERTVRMCIEALPDVRDKIYTARLYAKACVDYLEALLPKPDRAEELVKKYQQECPAVSVWGFSDVKDSPFELKFAKWLIERGEIKG